MKVAIGIIIDAANRILVTQRAPDGVLGGLWEFPGGRFEADESAIAALSREIKEEVGLDVLQAEHLGVVCHAYPHHWVELWVYAVHAFSGEAVCCERQTALRWVDYAQLHHYAFPEANQKVLDVLRTRF